MRDKTHRPMSHSAIMKYRQCPAAYRYHYMTIDGRTPKSDSIMRDTGIAVHQWFDEYNAHLARENRQTDITVGCEIADEILNKITQPEVRNQASEIIERLLETVYHEEETKFFAEMNLAISINKRGLGSSVKYDSKRAAFRGKADLVELRPLSDGVYHLVVSDLKTGFKKNETTDVKRSNQLSAYAYMAWLHFTTKTEYELSDTVTMQIIERNGDQVAYPESIWVIKKRAAKFILQADKDLKNSYEYDKFDFKVNDMCAFCEQRWYCEALYTDEDKTVYGNIVSEFLAKKEEVKNLEANIKQAIKESGRSFVVGGRLYGPVKEYYYQYPLKDKKSDIESLVQRAVNHFVLDGASSGASEEEVDLASAELEDALLNKAKLSSTDFEYAVKKVFNSSLSDEDRSVLGSERYKTVFRFREINDDVPETEEKS